MRIAVIFSCLFLCSVLICQSSGNPFVIVGVFTYVLGGIMKAIERSEQWAVVIENHGRHHAHVWCASKDDRIGGNEGVWIEPGKSLGWSFRRRPTTQFWCTMDWWGQRVGWDVYVNNWNDAPNPTKWSIKDDGVYDQWRNRKWHNLRSE